ncbi:MAG: hypothetical protein MHM6MM_005032 [Cercozoa sp. M6MM]
MADRQRDFDLFTDMSGADTYMPKGKNYGSTAGANTSTYDVFRSNRRLNLEREAAFAMAEKKQKNREEFEKKQKALDAVEDAKRAKRAEKRRKKKARQQKKRQQKKSDKETLRPLKDAVVPDVLKQAQNEATSATAESTGNTESNTSGADEKTNLSSD